MIGFKKFHIYCYCSGYTVYTNLQSSLEISFNDKFQYFKCPYLIKLCISRLCLGCVYRLGFRSRNLSDIDALCHLYHSQILLDFLYIIYMMRTLYMQITPKSPGLGIGLQSKREQVYILETSVWPIRRRKEVFSLGD